jgi:hypothetical protein
VPLNVAYVDERRELFAWAPERLVLELRAAPDLRAHADTVIAGDAHAVVAATIDGFPFTAFFRRATGLPTAVRFRADETNDFGLAPWSPMDVEIWYSRWAPNASGRVVLPRQWDTKRVGRAYKRMSVLSATFNAPMPPDSLVLPDTVARLYLATGRRPMADRPLDSARVVVGRSVVAFYGGGAPAGAVRLGGAWHLLDDGNLPLNAERAAAWIASSRPGDAGDVGFAIMTANRPGGVAAWAAATGQRVYVGPAGVEANRLTLRNRGLSTGALQLVAKGRWLRAGGARDSAWVEPIDLANGAGLLLYLPAERWAYSGAASGSTDLELVAAAVRRRGWTVDRVGTPGRLAGVPVP